MAVLRFSLILAICLTLGHQTLAENDAPCQPSKRNNGYNTFLKRHIRSGTPNSYNYSEWKKYIMNNGGCERPTQSLLHPDDLERVRAVCTNTGGKTYKENLCISKQPFSFITVRSEMGTCGIRSVKKETKHLILACEVLENQCVPVHFEGNPNNLRPNNNQKDCQGPQIKDSAPSFKIMWLQLLLVLLIIMYGY